MTKLCIFCGKRVNSQEHAWPEWLLKLLRHSAKKKLPISMRSQDGSIKSWLSKNGAIKVGNVCKECNNGWMSQLEAEAIPILTPMILGQTIILSAVQQLTISAWLTKTTMIFDNLGGEEPFYDVLDRHHFKGTLTPSFSCTNIWLGGYSGSSSLRAYTEYRMNWKEAHNTGNLAKLSVYTMAFGRLVLQIGSIKKMGHEDGVFRNNMPMRPGFWDDATVQIWPPIVRPVEWPPTLTFNNSDRHLQFFTDRFD